MVHFLNPYRNAFCFFHNFEFLYIKRDEGPEAPKHNSYINL